jgi:hypothetical protein
MKVRTQKAQKLIHVTLRMVSTVQLRAEVAALLVRSLQRRLGQPGFDTWRPQVFPCEQYMRIGRTLLGSKRERDS